MNSSINFSGPDLATKLLDLQPDSVVWFAPVFSDDSEKVPADFEVGYCNIAASRILGASRDKIIGARLKASRLMDEVSRQRIFEQCLQVWTTRQQVEFTYYSPGLDKYFNVQRSPLENGILSVTRDHTLIEKTRGEKERQSKLLDEVLEIAPYGVSLYEAVRDENGKIKDFRMKLCNRQSSDLSGFNMEDLFRYTVKELMMVRGQMSYFDICSKVVESGESFYHEQFSNGSARWIGISIVKCGDGYLLNYIDITHRKNLESRTQKQAELLEAVLNGSLMGICAMEAIYGFSGKILDFRITVYNTEAEKFLGIRNDEPGKTYLMLRPTAKSNGLFDLHCQVMQTGTPARKTVTFMHEGVEKHYLISVSKIGDSGVVESFTELPSGQRD